MPPEATSDRGQSVEGRPAISEQYHRPRCPQLNFGIGVMKGIGTLRDEFGSSESAGAPQRLDARARMRIAETGQQVRTRIDGMEPAHCQSQPAVVRRLGRQQLPDDAGESIGLEPAQGRSYSAGGFRSSLGYRRQTQERVAIAGVQGRRGRGERLCGAGIGELFAQPSGSFATRDQAAVLVRGNSLVETCQVTEGDMTRFEAHLPRVPESGKLLDVLIDDSRHNQAGTGCAIVPTVVVHHA